MQTCKGCKWAQFTLTKNGRINPNGIGRCTFPVETLWRQMPVSVTDSPLMSQPKAYVIDHKTEHDCPQWASN